MCTLTFLKFYKQESGISAQKHLATVFVGKSKEGCSLEKLNFLYINT